jgi:HupE / UreJ protein
VKRIAIVLAIVTAGAVAEAHPMDIGYLRMDVADDSAQVALDIDVRLAAILLGTDEDRLDAGVVTARAGELANATYRNAPITIDARWCAWSEATAVLHERTISLTDRADCPAAIRALRWPVPFVARAPSTFRLLVKARAAGREHAAIVDATNPVIELTSGTTAIGFFDFMRTGIAHIGAAPSEWRGPKLPDGIDHILFVIALLLTGGTIKKLAGVATGFTVGHSVTLALSVLGIARPPAALIEPLIALSIAIVAAEALLQRPAGRWKIATVFGMIHGFGFARALADLDLSTGNTVKALFGYNLGVEIGQLAIIVAVAPLLVLARRHPVGRIVAMRVAPALIFIAGMVWFVRRLFG